MSKFKVGDVICSSRHLPKHFAAITKVDTDKRRYEYTCDNMELWAEILDLDYFCRLATKLEQVLK